MTHHLAYVHDGTGDGEIRGALPHRDQKAAVLSRMPMEAQGKAASLSLSLSLPPAAAPHAKAVG